MLKQQLKAQIPVITESTTVLSPLKHPSSPTVDDLPPALFTGFKIMDDGRCHLLASINTLRKICIDHIGLADCSTCTLAMRHNCEENLVGMLGDLISFVLEHFKAEEEIMRDSLLLMVDRDHCEAHMEDHAEISGKVQEIVAALDPMNTVSRIRELEALLSRWLTHHIALHDVLLARWVERDDSALKQPKRSAY